MELNLIPASASKAPVRIPTKKPQGKGSWRKRRREEVIQKAREGRRLRPSPRAEQKSQAFRIQAKEFESGIEKSVQDGDSVAGGTGEASSAGLPGVHIREQKAVSFAAAREQAPPKKKPRAYSAAKVAPVEKQHDSPAAVSATLEVLGKSSGPIADGSEKPPVKASEGNQDKEGCEVISGSGSGAQSEYDSEKRNEGNETFAASSFEETGLYRSVALHLSLRLGLEKPTKIQEEVLKAMLNLREGQESIDVLVRSATGSGKTLAYLLPITHYLLNRARKVTREDGALGIVVVPTRELADQVEEVAARVFRPWHWIVVGSVRGGESKRREKARLRKGINVLVATPGRLLDHMRNTRSFVYDFCEFLVLDEADRLLDLGFEGEIKEMIENLDTRARASAAGNAKTRSNILLSATLRNDVEKLAQFSLQNPVEVSVGQRDENSKGSFAMPTKLRQHFCIVEQRHRLVTLTSFLRLRAMKDMHQRNLGKADEEGPVCKIIVFFSTCDSVDFHYELFNNATLPPELRRKSVSKDASEQLLPLKIFRLHGGHEQSERVTSLRGFRNSQRAVLFCTDVAARGLDLKGLSFAIQYDPPTGGQGEELEYLHRAGRTARIGAQGDALLFLLPSERAYIGKLESKGVSIAEISGSVALASVYPKVDLSQQGSISYATRLVTSALQESFEQFMNDNDNMKRLAFAGFQAYCRAYATHARDVRYFFHVRNLHLGHVARAFVLSDKPAEFSQLMAEIKSAKLKAELGDQAKAKGAAKESKRKGDIAKAIAEGEKQPYNAQDTMLARRRRERGRGQEAFREIALEFGS